MEDRSILEFKRLLPDEWVCRPKEKDYGVDLEVEIFEADGRSTGLLFYVQLKATDSKEAERSVRMKFDRLEYLASLAVPSVLVRYCSATRATHFMWIGNVLAQVGSTSASTVTIKFLESDSWDENTPSKLLQTVKVIKTIKAESKSLSISLTVDEEGMTGSDIFELKLAAAKLQSMSKMINSSREEGKSLPIVLRLRGDAIVASIDVMASITWIADSFSHDDILPVLTYTLAFMTGRYEFHRQSLELIRIVHASGYTTKSRLLASRVAQLAMSDPDVAADIACRNRIHAAQDGAYLEYINALLSSELPMEKRAAAIKAFYKNAIADHELTDDMRLSAVIYSLANFEMNIAEYRGAIGNYNRSRKLNPSYLQRTYFLNELGSCCFWSRRFKAAARFYGASFDLSPNPKVGICVGDALLYSGDFSTARKMFEGIGTSALDQVYGAEASLKAWLSAWLEEFYRRNNMTGSAVLSDRATWFSVIDECVAAREYAHALGAALVEAFLCGDDVNLWADAMTFAFNTGDDQLIFCTFSCAIWRSGLEVYAAFRKLVVESHPPSGLLDCLDQIASLLYEARPKNDTKGVTSRIVSEHNFDTIHDVRRRTEFT